ncbi:MAG TPA: hypothetical protein PKO23_02855 [Candidatus Hydrogenedentes bacterium]|jgi:chromosome segregation ATPase|nr:hypothetical protein [Candidatus Hydrogenedentota bacterium]
MEHNHDNQALHLLQEAYDANRKRVLQSQNMFVERLGQVKLELDGMLEALRLDFHEGGAQDRLYQEALDKLRTMTSTAAPEEQKESNDTVAHIEDELFRTREALSASEDRVKELQEQLQAGISHNLNLYIENLKSHLTKKNEIIDTARKRILRLQQKIEGMAYERMEALQHVADLNMRISSNTEAISIAETRLAELQHKYSLKLSCMAAVNAQLEAVERRFSMLQHRIISHGNPHDKSEHKAASEDNESNGGTEEFKAQISKQAAELEDANTLLELMQVDLNACQEKIQEEEHNVLDLREALASAESQALLHKEAHREREEMVQVLSLEKISLEETLAQSEEYMRRTQESLKQQEIKSLSLEEALQAANTELAGYKETMLNKEEEMKTLLSEKDLLREELKRSKGTLSELEDKYSGEKAKYGDLSQVSDRLTRELHQASKVLEQRTAEVDALRQELEKIHHSYKESSVQSEDALKEQRHLLAEARQHIEVMRLEIDSSNTELQKQNETISELKREAEEREQNWTERHKKATDEIQSLKNTASQAKKNEEQIRLLTESLETERTRATQSEASLANALAAAAVAENGIVEAERRRVDAQLKLEAISGELDDLRKEHAAEIQRKEHAEKTVKKTQDKLQLQSEETERLSSRMENAEEELQEARIALAETRAEIEKLRETVYEALLEKDSALLQVKEMKEKLQVLDKMTKKAPSARTLTALQEELAAERRRADMTQQLLDESLSGGTKGKLLQQLSEAKRDCESAKEELRLIQAKMEAKK